MSKLLSLFCFLLFSYSSFGQDWNYYQPIKAVGEVPQDFTQAYFAKYAAEQDQISDQLGKKDQNRHDEFYERSEFFIDQYLTSGRVFYGDTITSYCQMVLDKIIGDDEDLKNSVRVYTVKSPLVNATATANGIIFINLGLIAQLETEAQLAFVLSHELTHFTNDHVLDQYIEEDKVRNGEAIFKNKSEDFKLDQLSNYSKNHEFEADEDGFKKYFEKSGYSQRASLEILEILQYAYLPFDVVKFDKSIFENQNYKIPNSYLLEKVSSIKAVDDYDDENSSHPNLLKRKKRLNRLIKGNKGEDFIISESIFKHCQKMARYELSRLYLIDKKYVQSIYNSFLLLRNDSNNRYLRLSIAKALHALGIYDAEFKLNEVLPSYEDIEGDTQQLYYLISKLGEGELSILSLNYIYQLKKDFPDDKTIDAYFQRAVKCMVFQNHLRLDDFYAISQDSLKIKSNDLKDSLQNVKVGNSKIARIKSKKIETESAGSENYWKYAFVDFMKDDLFVNAVEDMESEYDDLLETEVKPSKRKFKLRNRYATSRRLGIDSILFLNSSYLNLDLKAKDGIKYTESKENGDKYCGYINECSNILGLNISFLDYKSDAGIDNQTFNNLAILQSWVREKINLDNYDVLVSDSEYLDPVIEQIGSRYISKTGNITIKGKRTIGSNLYCGIMILPLAPLLIEDYFTSNYQSFNYFYLFDLKTGKSLMTQFNSYKTKDSEDVLKSMVYSYLLQIKEK